MFPPLFPNLHNDPSQIEGVRLIDVRFCKLEPTVCSCLVAFWIFLDLLDIASYESLLPLQWVSPFDICVVTISYRKTLPCNSALYFVMILC